VIVPEMPHFHCRDFVCNSASNPRWRARKTATYFQGLTQMYALDAARVGSLDCTAAIFPPREGGRAWLWARQTILHCSRPVEPWSVDLIVNKSIQRVSISEFSLAQPWP
jgi:hypothetical protein